MKCFSASLALASAVITGTAAASETAGTASDHLYGLTPQEAAAVQSAITSAREISKRAEKVNGLPYRRDAHAKATGCVRALFSINNDIPERFRYSLFGEPARQYQAWIRFSNGDMLVQADKKPDARGMAIKVMGVEGEAIAPELGAGKTQDFIMTNTPAFFNRNVFDYADDMTYLAKFERTRWFVSLFPPRLHPKQFYRAVQTVSSHIDNPLAPQYYSMLPYQLGTQVLKFSARPCGGMQFRKAASTEDVDYLTTELEHSLSSEGACFDFLVQPQVPGSYMPIDDATVVWSETDSPFEPIARITIPPQQIGSEDQRQFCENLSMNPWHGVGAWEPLGSLSKARRLVYNAVSKYRHEKNQARRVEPSSWCLRESDVDCSADQVLTVTPTRWPLPRIFDPLYQPSGAAP
ncbi:MAG: catalase family protein [Pseudomonadota bacterium]